MTPPPLHPRHMAGFSSYIETGAGAGFAALGSLVPPGCQSASNFDPLSASNFDPLERRVRTVALAPSELVRVAETARARVVGRSSARLLKRQLSFPVSMISQ